MKSKKVALIDGDEIAYAIALKYQTKKYKVVRGDTVLSHHRYKIDAIEAIENEQDLDIIPYVIDHLGTWTETQRIRLFNKDLANRLSSICKAVKAREYHVFLSGEDNFRLKLAKLAVYKGNRNPDDKPVHLAEVRSCMRYAQAIRKDFLEADDLLSIYSTTLTLSGVTPVICSSDKDLRTVEGMNFNISKRSLSTITKAEAMYNFYYQLMIGDKTDNIPSPNGLGEIRAMRDLKPLKGSTDECAYYKTVAETYLSFLKMKDESGGYKTKWYSEGMNINDILFEIGNLLYMRRTLDENERWVPPFIYEEVNDDTESTETEKEESPVLN